MADMFVNCKTAILFFFLPPFSPHKESSQGQCKVSRGQAQNTHQITAETEKPAGGMEMWNFCFLLHGEG
jgi:hypothetical protein